MLGAKTGVRARGVDEGHHGNAVFFGHFHLEQGFPVALGVGTTEVAGDLLAGLLALLVADDHDLEGPDASEPRDQRRIVAEAAVAVQFVEVATDHVDVVAGLGPHGVACDSHRLPGAELAVDVGEERLAALAEFGDFVAEFQRGGVADFGSDSAGRDGHEPVEFLLGGVDSLLEFDDGLLEIQLVVGRHGPNHRGSGRAQRRPEKRDLAWSRTTAPTMDAPMAIL